MSKYFDFIDEIYEKGLDFNVEIKNKIKEIILNSHDIENKVNDIYELMEDTAYEW